MYRFYESPIPKIITISKKNRENHSTIEQQKKEKNDTINKIQKNRSEDTGSRKNTKKTTNRNIKLNFIEMHCSSAISSSCELTKTAFEIFLFFFYRKCKAR